MWTNREINLMLSYNHYSDQCQPILYRFSICCSMKPSAVLKRKKNKTLCQHAMMQLRLGMSWLHQNLSSNFMAVILRKFTFCHIIHLLIYLERKFESWSRLISFMLPPEWTVNKCYITFPQLSPMVLKRSITFSLYQQRFWIATYFFIVQNKHTNGSLFLKPQSNEW